MDVGEVGKHCGAKRMQALLGFGDGRLEGPVEVKNVASRKTVFLSCVGWDLTLPCCVVKTAEAPAKRVGDRCWEALLLLL